MLNLDGLRAALPNLKDRDLKFANDLLSYHGRKGYLTPGQAPWVDKLIARATQAAAPAKPAVQVGDLSKLLALFDRPKLKRPAIVIHLAGIGEMRISVATNRAKVPGSLNIATNALYGESTWFGRVKRDGTFEPSQEITPPTLIEQLRDFADRPAQMAAEHGRLTGRCCFCDTALETDESTAVGYGPVCAKRWGLPWGKRAAAAAGTSLKAEAAREQFAEEMTADVMDAVDETIATGTVPAPAEFAHDVQVLQAGELAEDRWNETHGDAGFFRFSGWIND
jgi:hypothetical protein